MQQSSRDFLKITVLKKIKKFLRNHPQQRLFYPASLLKEEFIKEIFSEKIGIIGVNFRKDRAPLHTVFPLINASGIYLILEL